MAQRSPRRGLPVAGLFLITIGVLLLLQTLGILSWDIWLNLWRFWPALIIIVGVGILLGRRAPLLSSGIVALLLVGSVGAAAWISANEEYPERISELQEPLGETKYLDLTIQFGAGTITLDDLPEGSSNLVEAEFRSSGRAGEATHSLTRSGDKAELVLKRTGSGFFGRSVTQEWDVLLSRDVAIDLVVQSGASDITLDLERLQVAALQVDTGASDTGIVLPGAVESTSADISVGAANLVVTVPEGVAARIDTDTGLASVNIDKNRFPKTNGYNQSPDYDTAKYRVDLNIDGGVANIEVR